MIVVVATEFDPHADAVISEIRRTSDLDVARLDLETVSEKFRIDWSCTESGAKWAFRSLVSDAIGFGNEDIDAIWWRRTSSFFRPGLQDSLSDQTLDAYELHWAARWILESIQPERFPMGHPVAMRAAENKLRQLECAARLGFRTPRTIISSSPNAILDFARSVKAVVVKPLHASIVPCVGTGGAASEGALFVGPVPIGETDLRACLEGCVRTALCVQERMDKTADVRVTVLPTVTVACAIDNSGLAVDEVDWRPRTFDHKHQLIDLPPAIDGFCRAYLREMGLAWGAFDFTLSALGEWCFLECNPNGQWLWIELKTGVPLSRYVARTLMVCARK
jgi:hypothetical protein